MVEKEESTYLAAPFFNKPQVQIVEQIEYLAEAAGHRLFSPRSAGILTPESGDAERGVVLQANLRGLSQATSILALLQYELPRGDEVALLRNEKIVTNLSMPDTGVAWEMGVGHASGIPVYGFVTSRGRLANLNVMLAHSCAGVISGWGELALFLSGRKEMATKWTGTVN